MLIKLFRKIWAIYGLAIWLGIFILLTPIYAILLIGFPKSNKKLLIWLSHKVFARLFVLFALIRVNVKGLERFDATKKYVIISNHISSIDFMLNALAFPGIYCYLAKKEAMKAPIIGFIMRKMAISVDRSNAASRSQSLSELRKLLAEGYSVFLYPEGTRNRTNQPLLAFKDGAFLLAIEMQIPILVQTIVNIKKVSASASPTDLCPGTATVIWSKALETKGKTLEDLETLKESARQLMLVALARIS